MMHMLHLVVIKALAESSPRGTLSKFARKLDRMLEKSLLCELPNCLGPKFLF